MRYSAGSFFVEAENSTACLRSLVLDNKEIAGKKRDAPLFSFVALDKNNERISLTPLHGRCDGEDLVFDTMAGSQGDFAVRVVLHATEEDGALQFKLAVDNGADIRIVETLFDVQGLALPQLHEMELLYPHHAGEKIKDPVNTLRSEEYQKFWRAYSRFVDGEWLRECNYCGLCSMSWMYLQNAGMGLYLGSHDARFPVTGLMTKTGGEKTPYMSLGFRIHKQILPGESWQSGEFVIALSHSDWHAGAQRYRKWIMPHLDIQKQPDFLKNEAALNQCYNFKREESILNRFENIPGMWEEGHKRGIDHMFIASWNRTGFDSYYPEYYPDMELGTALDFRRGIDYVNQHGGFATLYVNARISDIESDFHPRFLSRMQMENEKREVYTETYGPHSFTLNCPSDEMWQHMLVDTCDFAAESYHLKGIYLDQLASAEPFACYNPNHSHKDIGEFNQGYLKILKELLDRLRARDPESYIMTENCGDIYGAYTWGNLTWNGTDYDEYYNMFRYTFPEFVQVNMCNDRSWEKDDEKREKLFYSDVERCILMGNILWIGITSRYLNQPELQEHFDYLMAATRFRKRIAQQVSNGTYLDDAWVNAMDKTLHASCFAVDDQEALLLVGNCTAQGGQVQFVLPFAPECVQGLDENEQEVVTTLEGNTLTVQMNASRLVHITVRR